MVPPSSAVALLTAATRTLTDVPAGKTSEQDSPSTDNLTDDHPTAQSAEAGDLRISGGTAGTDWRLDDTVLHIMSAKPMTVQNAPGKTVSTTTIEIDAGVHADLTFSGVNISSAWIPLNLTTNKQATADGSAATEGNQILPEKRTSLHLTLADGSENRLVTSSGEHAALRCGDGSVLTIDDGVRNIDTNGNEVVPEKGLIGRDVTLACGRVIGKGAGLSALDSGDPGSLTVTGGQHGAGIGGGAREAGGTMTFNGGVIVVQNGACYSSAGIGGGGRGSGTATLITFNSGTYNIQGGIHGAGVGAGGWDGAYSGSPALPADHIYDMAPDTNNQTPVGGNILINGGYLISKGGSVHGAGFGGGCSTRPSMKGCTIRITGGTLLPKGAGLASDGILLPDLGGHDGYVVIEGGSVYVSGQKNFIGIGDTAWGNTDYSDDANKVFMVTIDLSEELRKNNVAEGIDPENLDSLIESWEFSVGGETYPYGAPAQFDKGKLYLWLPESAAEKTISVTLKYKDDNGNIREVLPLFREPDQEGDLLKRYLNFEIADPAYLQSLTKYYDGTPLPAYDLSAPGHAITTPPPDDKRLDKVTDDGGRQLIQYYYQPYDKTPDGGADPTPTGPETSDTAKDAAGNTVTVMPSNAGAVKLTMVSKQYADENSTDPEIQEFAKSYWGHRAFMWGKIMPIASRVRDIEAEWEDETDASQRPGDVAHPSDQVLRVSAVIDRADTVDGEPGSEKTRDTCQAARGRVQLYVDGKAVGSPIDLIFPGDIDENGKEIPADDPRVNATVEPNGKGGSATRFSLARAAATSDFLVPTQGKEGRHEISLQFLPPSEAQREAGQPANYLASQDPTKDPSVPRAEVAIEPIDPNPKVELPATPGLDPADAPTLETDYDHPASDDPASKYSDKTYQGTLELVYQKPAADGTNPGRIELKLDTPSSGAITVTTADGTVVKAEVVTDDEGNPVRDENGKITVRVDPEGVGKTELVIKQEPNGAYTGTTFDYAVTVRPQPKIAPAPVLAKKAENLTHPDGPTQPGDRIRYTVTASNTTAGSLWTQVIVTDPLPLSLTLNESTVRLDNPRGGIAAKELSRADSVGAADVGSFALSAPDAGGRTTLTVPTGDVAGGSTATATFECTVRAGLDFSDPLVLDLENIASAEGKRPNPDNPDGPDTGPVAPAPTDPAAPSGGATVAPADPVIEMTKAVENLTAPDASVTHLGDRLRYTIELSNTGMGDSCLMGAVVSDPLPAGIEPAAGTFALAVDGGEAIAVNDAAYDGETRTIAVTCGDLWGGHSVVLTFEAVVGEAALGTDGANIAEAHGTVPSKDPDARPESPDAGRPATPPTDAPAATTPPAEPPTIIPNDPEDGDVTIAKSAESLVREDGTTRVGDVVRYRITLRNNGPATGWMDAVIRDDVPVGIEPVSETIRLTLPDGSTVAVDDRTYDPASRILAVACGQLYGGQEIVLTFDGLVTAEALDADIGNVAIGYGTLPSEWDPADEHPAPGDPFTPGEGWDAWEKSRQKVVTDPVYPPGVSAAGGVLPEETPGDADRKEGATIRHKLAQTGDALAAAALLPLAAALAAGAGLLSSRRRMRRTR